MSAKTSVRKTARGLDQVPVERRTTAKKKRVVRRRKIRQQIFTLGIGLDLPLFLLTCVLLAIGLVVLFSASYSYSYSYYGDSYYFIGRQAGFAALGLVAMLLLSTFNYRNFHQLSGVIYLVTIGLLVAVLLFRGTAIAPIKGGANRWINLGFVEFQPSEIAKFALVVMLAHMLSRIGEKAKTLKQGFLPCFAVVAPIILLVVAEKHISAILIISLIAFIVMFVGGVKLYYFLGLGLLGGGALGSLVMFSDKFAYALNRIKGWIDPFNPPEGVDTYQTVQSLYAIGSGRLLGVGLGQSRQKHLYLPEPQNDFIFAIACEELGFIGALVIVLLFAMLIWRGVYVSLRARDTFGTLLGIGITFTIGLQAVLNICVVTNALPNTGISLPFFSYGGTSLIILLCEIGVLLSISRGAYVEKT